MCIYSKHSKLGSLNDPLKELLMVQVIFRVFKIHYKHFSTDENRDINIHPDDDLKRQRIHYSGDQLYSNVSVYMTILINHRKLINKNNKQIHSYGQVNGA